MGSNAEDASYTDFGDPRWSRVKRLFEVARQLPREQRDSYLNRECQDDQALYAEVRGMLDDMEEAGPFMESDREESSFNRAFQPGTILVNRFRIMEFIGSGGMGQVYRAEDMLSGGPVALKAIRPEIAHDSQSSRRFRRELRLSRQVTHPNVCRVYELWSTTVEDRGEVVFLTMELLQGETLASRLSKRGKLTPKAALAIARQVAAGIAEVHRIGIVHRDVKPSNVYLVPDESGHDRAVVMDFGLARTSLLSEAAEVTRAGAVLGTPAYMAPELFEGKEATVHSDIYGFGVTLYEMLTGRNRLIVKPQKLVAGLDDRWETAILQCLDPDPKKRPSSITGVIDLIEQGARPSKVKIAIAAGLALAAVLALVIFLIATRPSVGQNRVAKLTFDHGLVQECSYSADGGTLVYSSDHETSEGTLSIWVQDGQTGVRRQLVKSQWHDSQPAISPDGKLVAFRSERDGAGIYTVPIQGGAPRFLVAYGSNPRFSADGKFIAYWIGPPGDTSQASARAFVIPVSGGTPQLIAPQFADVRYPVWSPRNHQVLFWGAPTGLPTVDKNTDWFVENMDTKSISQTHAFARLNELKLSAQLYPVAWDRDALVFSARRAYTNNLWTMRFSADSPEKIGDPRSLTTGADFEVIPWVLPGGRVAYADWNVTVRVWRVSTNPGAKHRAELITEDDARDTRPTLSQDGRLLLFARRLSDTQSIYLKDLENKSEETISSADRSYPSISPDGHTAAYVDSSSDKTRILIKDIPSSRETVACADCGAILSWLPDSSALLFVDGSSPATRQIRMLNLSTREENTVLLGDRFSTAAVSPDGKHIAFTVQVDGVHSTIYTAPFERGLQTSLSARAPLTSGTYWDEKPQWSDDGQEIFFSSNRDGFACLWRQQLDKNAGPSGEPESLLHLHKATLTPTQLSHVPAYNLSLASGYLYFNAASIFGNLWELQQ